tara:strand:+ start:1015 stop:1131 length:117 start_codon:yes stop_codon:yes gene_type:complete
MKSISPDIGDNPQSISDGLSISLWMSYVGVELLEKMRV